MSRMGAKTPRMILRWHRLSAWLALLLSGLLAACSPPAQQAAPAFVAPATALPQRGETYNVATGTLVESVTARGRVAAKQETSLVFPLAGIVKAVHVGATDQVAAGAPLAELDAPDLERDVVDAQLDLATAQLNLSKAKTTARAQNTIAAAQVRQAQAQFGVDPGPIARAELEIAQMSAYLLTSTQQLDVDIARARVDWAESRLVLASEQLSDTLLVAPFDGVVISIDKHPGDPVKAYESIALLADPSELGVVATVFADQIDRVSVGQPTTMRLDAFPDRSFSGAVQQIGSQTIIWQGRSAYEVTIAFDPGQDVPAIIRMGADVSIAGPSHENVLLVPNRAILTIGGQSYVELVQESGQVERVPVQTGVSNGDQAEITSGLAEGQVIRIP